MTSYPSLPQRALVLPFASENPLHDHCNSIDGEADLSLSSNIFIDAESFVRAIPSEAKNSLPMPPAADAAAGDRPAPVPDFPILEFALQWEAVAGYSSTRSALPSVSMSLTLSEADKTRLANILDGSAQRNDGPLSDKLRRELDEAIRNTVAGYLDSCNAANLFTSPFLVVYALRLADGSHALPSMPVLMTPSSAPPQLRLDSSTVTADQWHTELTILNRPCRLLMRCDSPGDTEAWSAHASHIDIFISAQADFRLRDNTLSAGVGRMRGNVDSHSGLYAGPAAFNRMHPLADADSPMPLLLTRGASAEETAAEIASFSKFYRIAAIPLSSLPSHGEWAGVAMESVALSHLGSREAYMPDFSVWRELCGGKLQAVGGRQMVCAPEFRIPRPLTPGCLTQFTDLRHNPAAMPATVVAERADGSIRESESPELSTSFVSEDGASHIRWIFYPDPEATAISFICGRRSIRFPLQRHPSLWGAYWQCDASGAPGATDIETIPSDSAPLCRPDLLAVGLSGAPMLFPEYLSTSFGPLAVNGVAPALRSMSVGQFGLFPLYAFTSEGIWALSPSEKGGYRPVQSFSRLVVNGANAMVEGNAGIYFASGSELWLLEGTKTTRLADFESSISGMAMHGSLLGLRIDSDSESVVLFNVDKKLVVGRYSDNHSDLATIATRPLRLGPLFDRKRISEVEVMVCRVAAGRGGDVPAAAADRDFVDNCRISLYGSDSLSCWRLIAEAPGKRLRLTSYEPCRFHRLCLSFPRDCTDRALEAVVVC